MIELDADTGDLGDLLDLLEVIPKGLEKATARAVNKTLVTTRAHMVKMVRRDYNVKAGSVRNALEIRKARWNSLYGKIRGAGAPGVPLMEFVRGSKNAPSTKRLKSGAYRPKVGIPVLIRKVRGKKQAKGVFLARMPSGHVGAFKRGGESIREVYGPSPIKIDPVFAECFRKHLVMTKTKYYQHCLQDNTTL